MVIFKQIVRCVFIKLRRFLSRFAPVYILCVYIIFLSLQSNVVRPYMFSVFYPHNVPYQTSIVHRFTLPQRRVTTAKPPLEFIYKYKGNYSLDPFEIDFDKVNLDDFSTELNKRYDIVNRHSFTFIHDVPMCELQGDVKIVIMVKSAIRNQHLRAITRTSWLKAGKYENIKTLFMLASSTDDKNQRFVDEESDLYHDVIQEDFIDAYLNNTYKTIMGFNWASDKCKDSNVDYVLFVDDDFVLDLPKIQDYLQNVPTRMKNKLFVGNLVPCGEPYRDNESKWFLTKEQYPYDYWPPYLAGGAFLVSYKIVRMFSAAFPFIKCLPIDDSYLGIVARKLKIRPVDNVYFHTARSRRFAGGFVKRLEESDQAMNEIEKSLNKHLCRRKNIK